MKSNEIENHVSQSSIGSPISRNIFPYSKTQNFIQKHPMMQNFNPRNKRKQNNKCLNSDTSKNDQFTTESHNYQNTKKDKEHQELKNNYSNYLK